MDNRTPERCRSSLDDARCHQLGLGKSLRLRRQSEGRRQHPKKWIFLVWSPLLGPIMALMTFIVCLFGNKWYFGLRFRQGGPYG